MKTGYRGTFVISWTQTEVDGIAAGQQHDLKVGSLWVWRGEAIRVDGPSDRLRLDAANGIEQTRKHAARMVHKLVGAALAETPASRLTLNVDAEEDAPLRDNCIVLSDGTQSFTGTLIDVRDDTPPLIMFMDQLPPRDSELWVVHCHQPRAPMSDDPEQKGGVICFTPGTRVWTDKGDVRVEDLSIGSLIQTKDNGLQPIEWMGSRKMTGARLFAMPWLRPVRMRAGAIGGSRPEAELLVSPEHRIVIGGAVARDLFNQDEVLVSAKDLVNGDSVRVDHKVHQVTYVHLLLPRHEVIWANGLETESFHPASAPLSSLDDKDRAKLLQDLPELAHDPLSYGAYARRRLMASEAAILQHAA